MAVFSPVAVCYDDGGLVPLTRKVRAMPSVPQEDIMKELSFQALLAEVRRGNQEAAAEFMRRYAVQIRRIARIRLGRNQLQRVIDSTDICQSVMANFFHRAMAGQFDLETPEQLLRLLATMARNHVIKKAAYHHAHRRDLRRLTGPDEAEDTAVDLQGTPSLVVGNREVMDKLRSSLTDEEQQLLDDRIAGRSWSEIAEERNSPVDRVRKRLTRALERAVQTLEPPEASD
jgi:RNA polymerase sigma-70 factor (ECF subfamily)